MEAGSAEAGLTMTLKPELLVALARGEEHALRAVDVQGNAALAAEVLVLARHLRWDVEEELSRVLGDVVAHRLAGAARAFAAWHLDAAQRVTGALVDYATEEKKLLVRRAEFEALAEPLARLRDAIARLDKTTRAPCVGCSASRASSRSACATGCTTFPPSSRTRGRRLREALETLGPIFVKFGQVLSTRRDLLPLDIADELAKLQDQVPPFPSALARGGDRALARPADSGKCFARSRRNPSPAPRSRRCISRGCTTAPRSRSRCCARASRRAIARDLALLETAARRWSSAVGRRPAPEAARGGGRVRAPPRRGARSAARGGEREPARPQFRRLAAAAGARGVLGPVRAARDGDGAHARHADLPGQHPARKRHRHSGAGARRRRDLLHAGVPRRLLPRRHAPGKHPGGRATGRYIALDFGIMGTLTEVRQELPGAELPRLLQPRLPARRAGAPRRRLGARRARGSTSSRPRSARCASRSSPGR